MEGVRETGHSPTSRDAVIVDCKGSAVMAGDCMLHITNTFSGRSSLDRGRGGVGWANKNCHSRRNSLHYLTVASQQNTAQVTSGAGKRK